MKKILALFVCALLIFGLSACTQPINQISYTYRFGYITEDDDRLLESYTYDVTAADLNLSGNTLQPAFHLTGSGTYTVSISQTETKGKFKIETDFSFEGKYIFPDNQETDVFTDTIQSTSYTYIMANTFTPISTEKSFDISMPYTKDDNNSTQKAVFTSQIDYSKTGDKITLNSTVTDQPSENNYLIAKEANTDITMSLSDRIIDNEHIILAVRLQNIDKNFSDSFKVFDSLDGIMQTISVKAAENLEEKEFDNGSGTQNYPCNVLSASINSKYKGSDTLLYFAQNYLYQYEGATLPININLLLEFKHANLIYKLNSYTNYANGQLQQD